MDNDAKLRPLFLAKILYEQTDEMHSLTTAQLIIILENQYGIKAHRQTIKTEIGLLRKFGFEIQEVKSTQNRYNLFGRKFDLAELKLLIDAVESSKFITAEKSKVIVEKLSTLASGHSAVALRRNVSCEGRIKTHNEKTLLIVDSINEAINTNRQISFTYFKYDSNKHRQLKHGGQLYTVTPLQLVWNGDYYYMVCFREDKQQIYCFRIDRIATCPEILETSGTPAPEGFDVDEYVNTSFRMYGGNCQEVKLVCDNDVMDAIIDRFGVDVETDIVDENTFSATVNIAITHIFFKWVFGFCGKVRIKAPANVKEQYADMLREAMKNLD